MSEETKLNENQAPAFDLTAALPDTFVQSYKEGKFTTPDEAVAALSGHYQSSLKSQGWKDKNDLIGTHNAFQNNIQNLVKTFDPEADFSTAKDTKSALELAQARLAAAMEKIKNENAKKGNEGEETASQKKQLAQLEAALKAAAEEREKAKNEVEEMRKKSSLQLQQVEAQYESRGLFSHALEATKSMRIDIAERTIMNEFSQAYELQLVRDESGQTMRGGDGKPQYRVIQKSTGNILMDDRNGVPKTLDKVLPDLYRDMKIYAQQAEQKAGAQQQQAPEQFAPKNPINKIADVFNSLVAK